MQLPNTGLCGPSSEVVQLVNAFLNAITVILCAWLYTRARRIDKKEGNGNHHVKK